MTTSTTKWLLAAAFIVSLTAMCLAADPVEHRTVADPMRQRRTAVVDVFESCRAAVVNISSTQIVQVQAPVGLDSLFDDFFELPGAAPGAGGRRRVQEYRSTSVGSGFVIHPAGYLVTNAHVVARTAERKVIFTDKREFDAEVIAIDTARDLAVLKINADAPLHRLALGRSSDLMVGETAKPSATRWATATP